MWEFVWHKGRLTLKYAGKSLFTKKKKLATCIHAHVGIAFEIELCINVRCVRQQKASFRHLTLICCFLFNCAAFPLLCSCFFLLSFLLPVVHVRLFNLAFLIVETSHPFGLVHSLPFVYILWHMHGSFFSLLTRDLYLHLTSAFLYTHNLCCFSLPLRPPVSYLHQAVALRHAQIQYEGEPANSTILDNRKICMLSSKKRCND